MIKNDLVHIIVWNCIISIVICIVFFSGCTGGLFKPKPVTPSPTENASISTKVIEKVIHQTDYLFTIFIISTILGLVAGLNGFGKLGFSVAFCSVIGLFLKMMISVTWMYYLAAGLVLTALVVGTIAIYKHRKEFFAKNTALEEIVKQIELYKTEIRGTTWEPAVGILQTLLENQQKETKQEVAKIKNGTKVKIEKQNHDAQANHDA